MPKGSRILVVEDNAALRSDLKELLELEGYLVRAAEDGSEAAATIANGPVQVIVSDYDMPNMNGDALRAFLRKQATTAKVPFIMMSGGIPPTVDSDPAYRFLKKPISIDDLISNIEQLIAEQSVSSQRAPE